MTATAPVFAIAASPLTAWEDQSVPLAIRMFPSVAVVKPSGTPLIFATVAFEIVPVRSPPTAVELTLVVSAIVPDASGST